jgi:membrane protein DedA with SNARE-associated domain
LARAPSQEKDASLNGFDLSHLGYGGVFLGTFIEGETFILLGGFLSHRGYLQLVPVILLATFGAFSGDLFYFLMGRHYGRAMLERSARARDILPWLERMMQRYHIWWIFGMRYLYGVRWLAAGLAGSSGMGWMRFSVFSLPACLLWAVVVGLVGYLAGELMESLLGDIRHYEMYALGLLVLGAVLYGVFLRKEERRLGRRVSHGDVEGDEGSTRP